MPSITDLAWSKHDPDPVGTALATTTPGDFLRALQWVEVKTRDLEAERLPQSLRMIRALWWLDFYSDKIDYFIFNGERGFAPLVPEAAAFATRIGAGRAATLLARIEALFPEGMPRNNREWSKLQYGDGPRLGEPARALGTEFAGYGEDLAGALRRWLAANADTVRRDLAAVAPTRQPLSVEEAALPEFAGRVRQQRTPDPAALDAVLATNDSEPLRGGFAFMTEAAKWAWSVPDRTVVPFDSVPETARMIILLDALVAALNSAGLLYVADWSLGDDFADLRRWIGEIGATTTGDYLDGFARLFPKRVVPTDRDKRADALQRAVDKAAKKGKDPLDALDDEYREAALLEVPARLREWMRANRTRLEADQLHAAEYPPGASGDDLLLKDDAFITAMPRRVADAEKRWGQAAPSSSRIGDVIALETKSGFAYLQVTHEHPFSRVTGPVLRVIEGTTAKRLSDADVAAHVEGRTLYYTMIRVADYLAKNPSPLSVVAEALPIPEHARAFPSFLFHWGSTRDGRPVFGVWDGGVHPAGQVVGLLTEGQLRMSVARSGRDPVDVAEDIERGWTPARDHLSSFHG